jgi:hypothetical protein
MFSSPAASPMNRSPFPRPSQSNRCHPERSEGSAFLFSPIRVLTVFLASPLFSYSCALFCHNENDNLFVFRRFRTLSQKHPGWGRLLQTKIFSFGNLTTNYSPLSTISFTIRTYEKRARNSRRIRTSKTQHLKPFRMNTCKKTGEGAPSRDPLFITSLSHYIATSLLPKLQRRLDHSNLPTMLNYPQGATRFRRKLSRPEGMPGPTCP